MNTLILHILLLCLIAAPTNMKWETLALLACSSLVIHGQPCCALVEGFFIINADCIFPAACFAIRKKKKNPPSLGRNLTNNKGY